MKITVFGAAGNIGRRITAEALQRRHRVTAVGRNPQRLNGLSPAITKHVADMSSARDVSQLCAEQDVVINATRPDSGHEASVVANTEGLLTGLRGSRSRLLVVGGAASLRVPGADARRVIDDSRFLDPALRHIGQASLDQYHLCCEESRLDWVYLSPPADIFPGQRTGAYRVGRDELLLDQHGDSRISIEDFAVAVLDEIESPRHRQQRFTVAY